MIPIARKLEILADAADDAAEDAPFRWYPSMLEYVIHEEQAVYMVFYALAHRAWTSAAYRRANRQPWHALAEAVSS